MNANNKYHWSFDYNYGAQNPQFTQDLVRTLRNFYTDTNTRDSHSGQTVKHVYNILPNYWRGYAGGGPNKKLQIGEVTVERSKNGGLWNYTVEYENTTSGEHLQMQFRCRDDNYRPLTDSWRVHIRNSGNDAYSELMSEGYLAGDSEVRLRINGTDIVAGTVDTSTKLTCNWALFDIIPTLAQTVRASDGGIDIVLLEDLEQLRPKSKIGFLESIQTPMPLGGYYVYGAGLLPSYWWLDADGNIAIASTFFETLVLREKIEGGV